MPADGVVLDVGAHAGRFTKLFARLAPRGRIFAFEPGAYALSVMLEIHAEHLARAGDTPAAVWGFFVAHAYAGETLRTEGSGVVQRAVPEPCDGDILWQPRERRSP